jgi:hypothetical protein
MHPNILNEDDANTVCRGLMYGFCVVDSGINPMVTVVNGSAGMWYIHSYFGLYPIVACSLFLGCRILSFELREKVCPLHAETCLVEKILLCELQRVGAGCFCFVGMDFFLSFQRIGT